MRALMLTPDEGHLDRRIAQEAASLAAAGWSVDIHSAVDPGLRYEGALAPGVGLSATPGEPRPMTARRRLLRRLKRGLAGFLPGAGRIIEALQYRTRDIAEEIERANVGHLRAGKPYDLLVAHDVPVFPLAVTLKGFWGSPLICDLHEVFPEQDEHFTSEAARAYWRRVEAGGLAAADGIIAVNDAVAEYVGRIHAPTVPCVVVHNAVPWVAPEATGGPTLRDLYPIPRGARIMLFAGSLRPHKQLEVLIEGFGAAALDGWVLAILGEGPLQPRLEDLVGWLGLHDTIFVGRHAAQDDLIPVAASADVGLLPYQEVGFNYLIATPNKLFEYIAARLPVATSRLPMIERIVTEHGTGGFVDFSTPATTSAGLRAFVAEHLPAIGPAALEAAARRFSWETDEPALLGLVDRVMYGRGGWPEGTDRPDRPVIPAAPPGPREPVARPPRGWW